MSFIIKIRDEPAQVDPTRPGVTIFQGLFLIQLKIFDLEFFYQNLETSFKIIVSDLKQVIHIGLQSDFFFHNKRTFVNCSYFYAYISKII